MRLRKILAFTLVELLVVISIIALLMGILLPSLNRSREQARRAVCMAGLRSIGQGIFLYAHDNDSRLVPGDWRVSWDAWGKVTEYPFGTIPAGEEFRQVNLGHLLANRMLPTPSNNEHVFFCPSCRSPDGDRGFEGFDNGWGKNGGYAPTGYMFNNALDGFDDFVQDGRSAVLSHKNKINFLRGDGSVHVFNVKPLIFDASVGPELLQDVSLRHGVCFPTIMLHRWLEIGEVDLDEARIFLSNPQGWANNNCTLANDASCRALSQSVSLSSVSKKSLACDVVGVWGAPASAPPPPPSG